MDRRAFLKNTGTAIAVAGTPAWWISGCRLAGSSGSLASSANAGLPETAWKTLAAVQTHLLPSEPGAPGASEIQAIGFLRQALAVPGMRASDRAFIAQGAERLDRVAREVTGRSFDELPAPRREEALRRLERSVEGQRWIAEVLGYVLESLLGDPVYGGNPDGLGWRWLEHTPGFPRPPANKRYFMIV